MKTLPTRVFISAFLVAIFYFPLDLLAAPESLRLYNLPSDEASVTLRLFSSRAGKEVLFAAATVRGIRTHAVHGRYTPSEALDQILSGTILIAVSDEMSGAFAIRRKDIPAPDSDLPPPALPRNAIGFD